MIAAGFMAGFVGAVFIFMLAMFAFTVSNQTPDAFYSTMMLYILFFCCMSFSLIFNFKRYY